MKFELGADATPDAGEPGTAAQSLDQRILREQSDSLLSTSLAASGWAFLAALGFWVVCFQQTRQPAILLWAVLIHTSQAIRFLGALRYVRTPPAERDPQAAARRYCNALTFNAIVWGLAPWMFFPAGNFALMSLMMVLLLGMSSASVASLAPYRPALPRFMVPVLVGLASALLWQSGTVNSFLALCTLAYLYITLKSGLQQNQLLTAALRARYENEELARRLAEQVQKVEQASLEKTRFFASASHDLRQPLHSLGLFGAAILVRLQHSPDEPLARNMVHCVDALEASFSSMLDVSRLDAGVVELRVQPVALVDVFRRLQASLGRQAEAQGLALRFKPAGKWVHADPALLERLLGNLVHNALKFTETGGILVLARTRGDDVVVEVWDSGPGIQASELPRIFDEFYQVGNQERDRSKGLGMGLAIVRRLADLMRAPLEVVSRPGHGTVVKLRLPRCTRLGGAPALGEDHADSDVASGSFAGRSVLVVDDEETVRTSTAAALRLYGFKVEVADGLAQAVTTAERLGSQLDALVTDFRLRNGEDGVKVAAVLRQRLGARLPVLLVTGDTAPERVRQAQQSGLRVLYKPVKVGRMVEELAAQLAVSQAADLKP